jgi:hypothetical protein
MNTLILLNKMPIEKNGLIINKNTFANSNGLINWFPASPSGQFYYNMTTPARFSGFYHLITISNHLQAHSAKYNIQCQSEIHFAERACKD